jgi:hypothetical protein
MVSEEAISDLAGDLAPLLMEDASLLEGVCVPEAAVDIGEGYRRAGSSWGDNNFEKLSGNSGEAGGDGVVERVESGEERRSLPTRVGEDAGLEGGMAAGVEDGGSDEDIGVASMAGFCRICTRPSRRSQGSRIMSGREKTKRCWNRHR